tara:strand:+ start:336 stop:551 length:216 start_codon:yes stop_codon:yes gene_type:complete
VSIGMDEEYLMKCVVDPLKKTFYLYSSEGDTKEVVCDNTNEFMNVLELVRATCPDERLVYTDPITQGKNNF